MGGGGQKPPVRLWALLVPFNKACYVTPVGYLRPAGDSVWSAGLLLVQGSQRALQTLVTAAVAASAPAAAGQRQGGCLSTTVWPAKALHQLRDDVAGGPAIAVQQANGLGFSYRFQLARCQF